MSISRKQFLQQTGLACAATMLPFSKLFSAELRKPLTVDTRHPKNCTQNLVDNPFYDLSFIEEADFVYYKDSGPTAKDVLYKLEENVTACVDTSDPNFPQKTCDVTNHHDDEDISVLRYRAYYPRSSYTGEDPINGHDYEAVPLLLLFHPDGFQECIGFTPPGIRIVCQQLARRGFICITADYRAGRVKDLSDPTRVSVQQQIAPYRGIQDGRGAIRSIFKRNGLANRGGHNFIINPNQFFIGGQSAGSVVALGIAYYRNQAIINQVFPVDTGSLTIQQALGHINEDYYYGEPGSDLENPLYTPRIRAVLNCWGGIAIPKSFDGNMPPDYDSDFGTVEKGFFEAVGSEDANKINPPMIAFVGNKDDVIPVADDPLKQDITNSSSNPFKKENVCFQTSGNYILKPVGTAPNFNVYVKEGSSQNMYYILKELNRFTEFYIDCDMFHGIKDYARDNFDVLITSNAPDEVFTYIAERAAVFFQTCMNVMPYTNYPAFNYRGKSLFISTNYDNNINVTNHRICADNCTTTTTTCSTGTDDPCD